MRMINEQFIFWDSAGQIIAHLLFQFLASIGIGKYFPDDSNVKNSDPIIVMIINGNIVCPVNVGYLLEIIKNYILESTQENGTGKILDSLHKNTSLFSLKNLMLLPTLNLEFISDTADSAFFFFKNGVVKVSRDNIQILPYSDFGQFVWEKNIVPIDFVPIELAALEQNCDFMKFFKDLTIVDDTGQVMLVLKH